MQLRKKSCACCRRSSVIRQYDTRSTPKVKHRKGIPSLTIRQSSRSGLFLLDLQFSFFRSSSSCQPREAEGLRSMPKLVQRLRLQLRLRLFWELEVQLVVQVLIMCKACLLPKLSRLNAINTQTLYESRKLKLMTCKFWGVTASKRSFVESFSSYPLILKHKQRFTQEIMYL